MAGLKPLLTELVINHRLESCVVVYLKWREYVINSTEVNMLKQKALAM